MRYINIDNKISKHSNDEIFIFLKYALSDKGEVYGFGRFYLIAYLLDSITDNDLLVNAVALIRRAGFLRRTSNLDTLNKFDDEFAVKHRASMFSIYFLEEFYFSMSRQLNAGILDSELSRIGFSKYPPALTVTSDAFVIKHNLDQIESYLSKKHILYAKHYVDGEPITVKEKHFKKLIAEMTEMDFFYEGETFTGAIKYIQSILENLGDDNSKAEIIHDEGYIFTDQGFELFHYLMINNVLFIRGWQADVNYYYRRMYQDGYIRQRPEVFRDWFSSNYRELGQIKVLKQNAKRHNLYVAAKQALRLK